jgi:hypothetical protein
MIAVPRPVVHALAISIVIAAGLSGSLPARALAVAGPAWAIRSLAEPTAFSPNDQIPCEERSDCERYQLLVANIGAGGSSGPVDLTVRLPEGITTHRGGVEAGESSGGSTWSCTHGAGISKLICTFPENVPAGGYLPFLDIQVNAPIAVGPGVETAQFDVEGGGGSAVVRDLTTPIIAVGRPPFEAVQWAFEPRTETGLPAEQAGGHPWQLSTTVSTSTVFSPPSAFLENSFVAVDNVKNLIVNLPPGMLGDPEAVGQCSQTQLGREECPAESRVGELAIIGGAFAPGEFLYSGEPGCCSAIYNMTPERGYPAEFAFTYAHHTITLYASVVRTSAGYQLRAAATGLPAALEVTTSVLTFFGDPTAVDGEGSGAAFLTNPTQCGGALDAQLAVTPWEAPDDTAFRATPGYGQITNCSDLRFEPALRLGPSPTAEEGTTQADAPSAYTAEVEVPQTTSYAQLATPPLKDATVTLPAGVSVSPSAAQGLVGCATTGPSGINLGSSDIGPEDEDLGDPEATELGAGHRGGNESPYDDGLYHLAAGHCPAASTLGSVEVDTPLLAEPLVGHVYLAEPRCGGAGQPTCTEASATNGELYGLYVEAAGSGAIIKLEGSVAANTATGQLRATFTDNPQFPFSRLKFHFHGGSRAPLANPQGCGAFAATAALSSWGGQEAAEVAPSFATDWNGAGGACPAAAPFEPQVSAGSAITNAGAFAPFIVEISRGDREQDLSSIGQTLPTGLLAKIAGVPQCAEASANAGNCGASSQIGTASVTAGSGSTPITIGGGRIYLTGPYGGAPFGLSIVQPAAAGPFNLGEVVVRAGIRVDPNTSAVTVVSEPLPQIRDGVPFRIRTIRLEIARAGGFIFNPTNCSPKAVQTTLVGSSGSVAHTSDPFTATGCSSLPFHPHITAVTSAKTSKADGASLDVKVTQQPGEANIQKVDLEIPSVLPARLTTLNRACTSQVFEADPANCPAASVIGFATAITPVLGTPLRGPGYIVSHGGAAFPAVEFVLQGEGVTIVLDGGTQIKKGVTYSRFESVPDAPISQFEAILPEGPHSIFTAYGKLCARTKTVVTIKRVTKRVHGRVVHIVKKQKRTVANPLTIAATVLGQNGSQANQRLTVGVTGCPAPAHT